MFRGFVFCMLALAASAKVAEKRADVTVGKSVVIDSPVNVRRVAVANSELAEALVVNPREVIVNGRATGETSLLLWREDGTRVSYSLMIRPSTLKLDAARQELAQELESQDIHLTVENETAFLRGTATDLISAERAAAIAATAAAKVVNLLHVKVPAADAQILLKVRFANIDRAASHELGVNLFSLGALNTPGSISTGQFSPPQVAMEDNKITAAISDTLNVLLLRPDLNLGATLKALESKRLLEILAEPNVMAIDGKPASFVAGGEFPFPTLQGGGSGLGAVTIQFREFGVRINFLPTMTPRGTIRLEVTPEVSSLDFANGLVFQGFNIPALATRRVRTEVELGDGQSFAIAGLIDKRMSETLNKVPGIGDLPVLGKLFRSRALTRNNSELLVLVTPELVNPIPAGQAAPQLDFPKEFLSDVSKDAPRTPPVSATGSAKIVPPRETVPVERLLKDRKTRQAAPAAAPVEFVPVPVQVKPTEAPAPAGAQ